MWPFRARPKQSKIITRYRFIPEKDLTAWEHAQIINIAENAKWRGFRWMEEKLKELPPEIMRHLKKEEI